jgi:hemoglobin
MSDEKRTLYERLGGYEAMAAVANDLLPRLRKRSAARPVLGASGEDGINRENSS